MDGIKYWIDMAGSGHCYFFTFPFCLILLWILIKGRRVKFLLPSILITVLIVNPWFYEQWNKRAIYAYWRLLWIVPVIPVIAAVIPTITEKVSKSEQKKTWIKTTLAALGIVSIILGGTFLYNGTGGSFVETAYAVKLPDATVAIADRLLQLKNRPRIIADPSVSVYIRQYTGEIETLYGRNIYGYISSMNSNAVKASIIINDPEFDTAVLSQIMVDEDYDYLVIPETDRDMSSFELVDNIQGFCIYEPIGTPSVRRKYDDLGRVITETTLDEDGNPVNNAKGYCTVYHRYDDRNNIIYEFRVDTDGVGVADETGCAGFEKEFDNADHIIMHRVLGVDEKPVVSIIGYAEVRRVYKGDNLIAESYYDDVGDPTSQMAGFSSFTTEIDNSGEAVKRTYFDNDGKPVNRIEGYSIVVWKLEENGKTKNATFYNTDGKEVEVDGINLATNIIIGPDGWSEWMTPTVRATNGNYLIGTVNLGKKHAGDQYTSQIDIEFSSVEAAGDKFDIWAQGSVDGSWSIRNVWNPGMINVEEAPENGVYSYRCTIGLDQDMVEASTYDMMIRCDEWADGSFRIRNVMVEKGDHASQWKPGI